MEWWIALIVVLALGIAAAAAIGGMGEMAKEPVRDVYRQDLPARPLGSRDLDTIRFGITLRGYAMGQVDDLLDRVGAELAERDALIAELTGSDPIALLDQRRHPLRPQVEPDARAGAVQSVEVVGPAPEAAGGGLAAGGDGSVVPAPSSAQHDTVVASDDGGTRS